MEHSQSGWAPSSQPYAPSAPELPQSYGHQQNYQYAYPYGMSGQFGQQPHALPSFPPGTHPDVIRSFQYVDRDRSGFIDANELQEALSASGHERFSMSTIRLLLFLFKNPSDPLFRLGPREFAELWKQLGLWRAIFDRFDRDRSGRIDLTELRDALYSLGYALPPSVLQVLISKYYKGSGNRPGLSFDNFIECGMVVKGLTEKFKEKDLQYTGSATLTYDSFMSTVIPFLVSYD